MLITQEEKANARKNVVRYEWARAIRDRAVEQAERWAALSDEELWHLPTEQSIPRGIHVNKERGCPNCGQGIDRFGNYPWRVDVVHDPWKIRCPSCGERYPKNDFAAYYRSGTGPDGLFRRERADASLLYNTDHPDPNDPLHSFGVDDSCGWKDAEGNVYRFIGYYGHYGAWTAVSHALSALSEAYVFTGEQKVVHKAAILLARVADLYPDMDYHFWAELGFENSDGGSGRGKVYGRIWEARLVSGFARAYDAIRDGFDEADTHRPEGLYAFLREKAERFGLPPQGSAPALRTHIETRILRQVEPAILRGDIRVNEPRTQLTMATAAVVLNDPNESDRMLDWVFAPKSGDKENNRPGDKETEGQGNKVSPSPPLPLSPSGRRREEGNGGHIPALFAGEIDRDGIGSEASPGYSFGWLTGMIELDEVISKRRSYTRHNIRRDFPKFREMFRAPARLICLGRYSPHIGDAGATGSPDRNVASVDLYLKAFEQFGDPDFAQTAYWLNGSTTEGMHSTLFHPDPEQIAERVKQVIAQHGVRQERSDGLGGYGLAILRSGEGEHRRAAWIYYGRNRGHGHLDTGNLGLYAHGLDLLPDLGYPEYASAWPKRFGWTHHTVSHNTVMVDQRPQNYSYSGKLHLFGTSPEVQMVEIASGDVYPQCKVYRRTVVLVDISPTASYIVDLFRVEGGEEHHFSFHGPEGAVSTEGLDLIQQRQGTYAGEKVAFGEFADEPFSTRYRGSGFQYLYNVQRCPAPKALIAVDWQVKDTWRVLPQSAIRNRSAGVSIRNPQSAIRNGMTDVHLRWTMLDPPGEVAFCDGDPPQNKPGNPRRLKYGIVHSEGAPASTGFLSVIEPYRGERTIRSITPVSVEPDDEPGTHLKARALKITLADGRVDYLMFSLDPDRKRRVEDRIAFCGSFGLYSEADGQRRSAFLINGTHIGPEQAPLQMARRAWTGSVTRFERGRIYTEAALPTDGSLIGRWIMVFNDNERDGCYRIREMRREGGQTVLEVGEVDFVRGMVDERDYTRGTLYEIAEGDRFVIPLWAYWG